MARGHRLNTAIVLAAVHGFSGLFRGLSAVEPSLSRPVPPVSPSLISHLASVGVKQNGPYGRPCPFVPNTSTRRLRILSHTSSDTDGLNATLYLVSSLIWVGTMLSTPVFFFYTTAFVWVHSCRLINQFFKLFFWQPDAVCSSSLRLSQSVRTVVSYLIKTNVLYFLTLSVVGLTRLILFSNSNLSQAFELSSIEAFRWQCSAHCVLTLIVCHSYALWTQPDPRFRQTKSDLTAIQQSLVTKTRN